MKCINCQQEVQSAFTFAIKSNLCPACGKNIYSQDLEDKFKQLFQHFTEVKSVEETLLLVLMKYNLIEKKNIHHDTITSTVHNNEIIVSNVESTTESTYNGKIKTGAGDAAITANTESTKKLLSQERINLLRKRAGVDKIAPVSKQDKLKQLVNDIQSEDEINEDSDEMLDQVEPLDEDASLEGLFDTSNNENNFIPSPSKTSKFKENQLKQLHRRQDMVESGSTGLIKRTS